MTTVSKAPTSDEAVSGTWTGSAGTRYQAVDDYPDSGGTDSLTHGTTTAGNLTFGFSAFSIPSTASSISVQVDYYDQKSASQSCNIGGRLKVNGSYYNATTHNPANGTWTQRTDTWATNPNTSAAWTVNDVNSNLQAFGWNSTDANPTILLSSIQVTVTYINVYTYSGTGGITTGGATTWNRTKAAAVSGGTTLGGATTLARTKAWTPIAGGTIMSGTGGVLKEKVFQGGGGITASGSATTSFEASGTVYSYSGTGGVTMAGDSSSLKEKVYSALGGVTLASLTEFVKIKDFVPIGGGTIISGTATTSFQGSGPTIFTYTGSGGFTLDGLATTTKDKAYEASGGVVLDGLSEALKIKIFTPSGGVTLASSSGYFPAYVKYYTSSGGFVVAGWSVTRFVPAGTGNYTFIQSISKAENSGDSVSSSHIDTDNALTLPSVSVDKTDAVTIEDYIPS